MSILREGQSRLQGKYSKHFYLAIVVQHLGYYAVILILDVSF